MALDITTLDTYVADKIGTTSFVGGLLISLLFLIVIVIAVSEFTKSEKIIVLVGLLTIFLCAGLQWIPTWVPLIIAMVVAIMYGNLATGLMGGRING